MKDPTIEITAALADSLSAVCLEESFCAVLEKMSTHFRLKSPHMFD